MRVAIVNDTHAGIRNDTVAFADYQEEFYRDLFFPHLVQNGITRILHLGDVFDRRKYINFHSLYRYRQMFVHPVIDLGMKVDVLVGNHDVYYKSTNEINSPDILLSNIPNFNVIYWEPEILDYDGFKIGVVPWICDENRELCLDFIETAHKKVSVLAGHFEIQGFEMNHGIMCDNGLNEAMFTKYDTVMSGHFHTRSQRGSIKYLGSQMEFTWSDYNDQKGFHVFDTVTHELEFIPNNNRMFYKITYDDSHETPRAPTGITNRCLKVMVQTKKNPYEFEKYIDDLRKQNPAELAVLDHVELGIESDDVEGQVKTTVDVLDEYVEKLEIGVERKVSLKRLFKELYVDAIHEE